jgi:hypothetical protein
VSSQELADVVFQNQLGVDLGPVMRRADKGRKQLDVLQGFPVKGALESMKCLRRIGSSQKDVCSASKDCSFFALSGSKGKDTTPSPSHKAMC